jgi:hypothetical protein
MSKTIGIRLIKQEVKSHPDTFAPELEITIRWPIEMAEKSVRYPDPETQIGKEILDLLGAK